MKTFTFLLILILYLSKSECREIESDHYIIEDHNDDKHLLEVEGSGTKLQPDSKISSSEELEKSLNLNKIILDGRNDLKKTIEDIESKKQIIAANDETIKTLEEEFLEAMNRLEKAEKKRNDMLSAKKIVSSNDKAIKTLDHEFRNALEKLKNMEGRIKELQRRCKGKVKV